VFKVILLVLFAVSQLFSLEVSNQKLFENLLPNAEIYIDKNNTLNIDTVQTQSFSKNSQKSLGFGYSPNLTVWVKFKLENKSAKKIEKIIEYANPLTTDVIFFDPQSNKIQQDGLTHIRRNRESLNPIFSVSLEPHSSKTFYIKAYSHITTLIISVNLWDKKSFYKHEIKHQFILAMFFGAMGIIILYNFIIYWGTKEISYLYYVLFFISITIHHILYLGLAGLYLLSADAVALTVEFSAVFVALPALFLALFTQNILELKQYPKINKLLTYYLTVFPLLIILFHIIELHKYKNLFSMVLAIFLFFIIIYSVWKKNRQAYFLIGGWSLSIISGVLMYLSSLGILDIFSSFPYYAEFALISESLIFSFLLADKIKQLHREKVTLQINFISYQKEEKRKLSNMVIEKTEALNESLKEKELLLKELNHRVKNSIQTIVSFLRLQIDEIEEKQTRQILMNIENRILSISHLYALLYTKENICFVNTYEYFNLLIEDIETSYAMPHIKIELQTEVNIPSEYAIYCGFILNETITNSLQHAFVGRDSGHILIYLKKEDNLYKLSLYDNGIGYNENNSNSLGLIIIETLVLTQLQGKLCIDSKNGTKIEIEWRDNG
jgi:two-component sensor histidine kinase